VTGWLPDVTVGVVAAASRDTTIGVNLLTAYVPVTARLGIAGEWAFDERFTLLAERLDAFDAILTRIGVRIDLGEQASVDLSGGRISGSGNRLWGLGLTIEFGR
jgi:hypothetical protein